MPTSKQRPAGGMMRLAGRATVAILIGLPIVTVANVIGYFITLFTLTIFLGCFAPPWAIEGLAFMEFCAAMLYSVLSLAAQVLEDDPRRTS